MKHILYKLLIPVLMLQGLASCADFLNVNPKGEVFDADMYESAEGYEDALYGIYAQLGTSDYLYKNYLHWLPEVLAVNVRTTDDGLQSMSYAVWNKLSATQIRKGIWANSYKIINQLNNIIQHIEKGGDDEFRHTPLYKGEALALRALIHFELLRLYGAPIWAPDSEKARAIPYVTQYSFDITKFSSLDEAYELILKDLKEAEQYLAEDETLVGETRTNSRSGGFTACRIIHMNLHAVEALIARVYWSRNDLANAAIYAKKVIDSKKFGMRSVEAFNQPDNGTLDLRETIFGIYSKKYEEENARMYGLAGSSASSTFQLTDYRKLYETNEGATSTDYRFTAWFDDGQQLLDKLVNPIYYSAEGSTYTGKSILGNNILRIPEMYYIMAESLLASDPGKATEYFNVVISSRGLEPLEGINVTEEMLFNERRKEFFGEGFLWHDMKRLGKDIEVSAGNTLSGSDVSTYKIPYPIGEDETRDELNSNK